MTHLTCTAHARRVHVAATVTHRDGTPCGDRHVTIAGATYPATEIRPRVLTGCCNSPDGHRVWCGQETTP